MSSFDVGRVNATRVFAQLEYPLDSESNVAIYTSIEAPLKSDEQTYELPSENLRQLTVGLIDCYRLTRDCLMEGLRILRPEIRLSTFMTVQACVADGRDDFELILYYLHGSDVSAQTVEQNIALVREALPSIPIVIFSDADRLRQATIMHFALESGARGFVPTQATGLPIISAAINLVTAGGTFLPADLMLAGPPNRELPRPNGLTSRQASVMSHLRQGKANKVIAYELGMSESTVKVHVRNIMRKMGANNRTEAVYRAEMQSNVVDGAS